MKEEKDIKKSKTVKILTAILFFLPALVVTLLKKDVSFLFSAAYAVPQEIIKLLSSKRFLKIIMTILFLASVVLNLHQGYLLHENELVEVPNLVDMELDAARMLLEEKELMACGSAEESTMVIGQNPHPGIWVKKNTTVELTFETAKPNIANMETTPKVIGIEGLVDAVPGKIIFVGSYKAEDDLDGKAEQIKWRVLDKQEDRVLVIAEEGIDSKPYNTFYKSVTWETCTLRLWLNEVFIKTAFSEMERGQILAVPVIPEKNTPGYETTDRIFLLNADEVEKYFEKDGVFCKPSKSVATLSPYINEENQCGWWWLRTSASNTLKACRVNSKGAVRGESTSVSKEGGLVRPAMWLSIE